MLRRPKGWPSVRAQVRLQMACATRPIEKTGDSSTPLRMTCVAITIGEPRSPHLRRNCHPEEAERPTKDLLQHRIIPVRFARSDT